MSATSPQADELKAAAGLYAFLAQRFLREPTVEDLRELRAGEQGRLLRSMGHDLLSCLHGQSLEECARELAVEYCRLFVGPGPHVSPHEAVMRGERRHWGEYTVAVNAAYRAAGFDMAADVREMPDHVGIELAFAAMVCEREAAAARSGAIEAAERLREARTLFLADHLGAWLPTLADEVADHAGLSFYSQLARLAVDWVANEISHTAPV